MVENVFHSITDIIKSDFKCSFRGGEVILQDSTSKPVKINKSGSFVCLQLDRRNSSIFPFFEPSIPGLCKISDRLIFYPSNNTLFVFVIELKSGNPTGAISQVRACYEVSKYICATAKRLLNNPIVEIKYRGLIFSHKNLTKGTTKPKNLAYTQDLNSDLMYKHLQSGNTYDLDSLTF